MAAIRAVSGAAVPLMIGHRVMGITSMETGDVAQSRTHYNQAIALYDPAAHGPLATRFGQDAGVAALFHIGRGPCGCLVIPTPRSQARTKRSVMRGKSARLLL
jgi:hypothetical protein